MSTVKTELTPFPNIASDGKADDNAICGELHAAGIRVELMPETCRTTGEVKTIIMGSLHGWTFTRVWSYWSAKGPGIPHEDATALWEKNLSVRVAGHCGNPSPLEWTKGLGVGQYHIDTAEGLKALADVINKVVDRAMNPRPTRPPLTRSVQEPVAAAATQEANCAQMRKPGGCQLHNLHCGYPKCNEPKE